MPIMAPERDKVLGEIHCGTSPGSRMGFLKGQKVDFSKDPKRGLTFLCVWVVISEWNNALMFHVLPL